MKPRSLCLSILLLSALLVPGLFAAADEPPITAIDPPELGFFSKQVLCDGIPIKAHRVVADAALREAQRRLSRMLRQVPDAVANLVDIGAEMQIIGKDQLTSDLPAQRHWKGKPYDSYGKQFTSIDERTRGLGELGASCGEENLLKLPSDRYRDHRDICSHEFAHTLLGYGLSDDIRRKVQDQYKRSMEKGLWKTAYASTNYDEYFAELTMWYFGSRGDYGHIEPRPEVGRDWLRGYDPAAFDLLDKIYSGKLKVKRIAWETLVAHPPSEEGTLRSGESEQHATVLFRNHTSRDYTMFWLDFDGKRKSYGTLYAGQKGGQNTFVTHPWLLAAADGKAVAIYVPAAAHGKVDLIEPRTADAPGR